MPNPWDTRQVEDAWDIAVLPTLPLVAASFGLTRVESLGTWWWLLALVGLFGIAMTVGVVVKGREATKRRWTLLVPVVLSLGVLIRAVQSLA